MRKRSFRVRMKCSLYSISNELTRKYYERSLKTFFDYMGFYIQSHLEERCNSFAGKGVTDGQTLNGLLFRADED